jgi:hypothetical protein
MKVGTNRLDGSGMMARWSALAVVAALGLVGCKPAPCGPTKDVRHRAKILVERYPANGDETRAVVKELAAALEAQPKAKSLPAWKFLSEYTKAFAEILVEMDDPNLDAKRRPYVGPEMSRRRDHLLSGLGTLRDQCGE